MNKNKIYLTVAVLSLAGMLGQYVYYETQVQAEHGTNEYTITWNDPNAIRGLEQAENAKGCEKLHTNFDDASGKTGTLIFTCDPRPTQPPIPNPTGSLEQRVQNIEIILGLRQG